MAEPYTYQLHGLRVASALECPELVAVRDHGEPDVVIRCGKVPTALQHPCGQGVAYQVNPDQFLLNVDQVARYLVQTGSEILVEPAPHAPESAVRLFLLGSSVGALLHQRGILALHASAIRTKRGGVVFAGPSGAGKSTLLAAFLKRGYSMLADDVTSVVLDGDGLPLVVPGYPQVKLWADVLPHVELGGAVATQLPEFQRVRPPLEKYWVPQIARFVREPVRLDAVYILTTHNRPELQKEPIDKVGKFDVFLRNTYREELLGGLGRRLLHFKLASAAANAVAVTRVVRPMTPFLLEELADYIEEDWS